MDRNDMRKRAAYLKGKLTREKNLLHSANDKERSSILLRIKHTEAELRPFVRELQLPPIVVEPMTAEQENAKLRDTLTRLTLEARHYVNTGTGADFLDLAIKQAEEALAE